MSRLPLIGRSRLLRALLLVVVAGVVGRLVSQRMTTGDEDSAEFQLATIISGTEFTSRSPAFRSASVLALMGGVELDLREAKLDPEGATLAVTAVMGGVEITLPAGWRVELETHGNLGGVDNRLTEPADLPDDAPTLRLTANAWLGGVEISNS